MKVKKFDPQKDYPLASKRPELVKTVSGLNFSEITLGNVVSEKIHPREIRISPETLEFQARIAEAHGRVQLATNFRRAAELTRVPDEEVLRKTIRRESMPSLSARPSRSMRRETFSRKNKFPLNSKHEIPAFAEAASRRQANLETSTNIQNTIFKTEIGLEPLN